MINRRFPIVFFVFVLCATLSFAQDRPIGYWRSHLPYNNAQGVATDGVTLYTICNQGFFTFNAKDGVRPFSKVEGMSDIGMVATGYDAVTSTVILAYTDGNIDLFNYSTETFFNIPDLKIKKISGTKSIHQVFAYNGFAYISTDIGVIVVDLINRVIKETYSFTANSQNVPINFFLKLGNFFYANSSAGLYRVDISNPQLQNTSVWQRVDSTHAFLCLTSVNNKLFLSDTNKVYVLENDTAHQVFISDTSSHPTPTHLSIAHIDSTFNGIWIGEYYDSLYNAVEKKMDTNYNIVDSFHCPGAHPFQALTLLDSSIWVADRFQGLLRRNAKDAVGYFIPEGPNDPGNFDIYAYNNELWIAHGGYTDLEDPDSDPFCISNFKNEAWSNYTTYSYNVFGDTIEDIVAIAKDRLSGTLYAGSFVSGLVVINPDMTGQVLKQNSVIDESINDPTWYQIIGLTFDNANNLFASVFGGTHELAVRDANGSWRQLMPMPTVDNANIHNDSGPLIADDYNHIWYLLPNGGGLIVYDYNGTIDDITDDKYVLINQGLPSNNTESIAKDKNGNIWVGTDNGVAVITNQQDITQFTSADVTIPIEQYDSFANYLFTLENVRTIAIDGANRKWVGTDNGVWLLSADESKIIYRFTVDNSPIPTNLIQKITIDPVTGDVYIGTQNGLVSFRSTATEGGTSNTNVVCFPNPVPSGYQGTISIKGLVANADVRITDISGQLVYRTTALGGQAVWNGVDYTGHRPQSGVYLVFITNNDGSQTNVTKMVFMN